MMDGSPAPGAQDGLEAFAALSAHQLGEAIALMRGGVAVLDGQRARLGPAGEDALRALNAGGDRAQRYVDDLLDVVRAGAEVELPVAADLDPLLGAALAELAAHVRRTGVHIEREPLPRAALEPRAGERLFTHLLRSALAAGATRVAFGGGVGEDGVLVEMLDDGTPARDGTDPFAPLAPPRGRGPLVGAGLSLPICRLIVARHGGSAALVTRPDGATLVTLRLPAPA